MNKLEEFVVVKRDLLRRIADCEWRGEMAASSASELSAVLDGRINYDLEPSRVLHGHANKGDNHDNAALKAEQAAVPSDGALSPCPHCGGGVDFHKDDECSGCHYIWCGQCNAYFDFATGADPENKIENIDGLREACAAMWNKRVSLAAAPQAEQAVDQVKPVAFINSGTLERASGKFGSYYLSPVRSDEDDTALYTARPPSDVSALVEALTECAASLAWNCFGECRAVHDGPIMPASGAMDMARAALQAHK